MMVLEVVGYKGVVGNATKQWLTKLKPPGAIVVVRDIGDPLPDYPVNISFLCLPESEIEKEVAKIVYADLIVIRSTTPPGTCQDLMDRLNLHICHNPEFLRAATSVNDIFNPDMVVIGACCQEHSDILNKLLAKACTQVINTEPTISELLKITINNYLGCLISFWNEIDTIAGKYGVSGHVLGAMATYDSRVSPYGARYHHKYDGKCLPKEVSQMIQAAEVKGVDPILLKAVKGVNECQEY